MLYMKTYINQLYINIVTIHQTKNA